MNLGAILIGFAILVVAVSYVLNPLVNEGKKGAVKAASQKIGGKGQQKHTLAAIRDLDFDFQTGKVTKEDYETLRPQLVLEAADYLKMKQQEDEKIDAMIRARLQNMKPSVTCEKCRGEIRPQDLFCPTCGVPVNNLVVPTERAARMTCPSCGKDIKEGDLFCTRCGRRVNEKSTSENTPSL